MLNAKSIARSFHFPTLLPLRSSLSLSKCPWHTLTSKSSRRVARQMSTTAETPHIEYNWIPRVEALEDYEPGGYHPIIIGDTLHNGRYQIADKLGHGGYSTVWLARDTLLKRYVALKVNTASSVPREPKVLKALSKSCMASPAHPGSRLVPDLLDEFEVRGPNGTHTCYTLTLAARNIRDASPSLIPLDAARALSYSLARAVAYVHSQGYVHGGLFTLPPLFVLRCLGLILLSVLDVHLNNALVALSSNFDDLSVEQLHEKYGRPRTVPVTQINGNGAPLPPNVPIQAVRPMYFGRSMDRLTLSTARLLLNDFGEAFSPASEVRLGQDCHTPPGSRAPEATFEPETPLTYGSDIWSLATALWEILGMKPVFSNEFIPEDEIIAQHIDVLGPLPSDWWLRWEARDEFFITESGQPTDSYSEDKWPPLEEWFEVAVQKWRRQEGNEIGADEKAAFLDLMRRMLMYRPEERLTADEVLRSDWVIQWALPDYERSLKN